VLSTQVECGVLALRPGSISGNHCECTSRRMICNFTTHQHSTTLDVHSHVVADWLKRSLGYFKNSNERTNKEHKRHKFLGISFLNFQRMGVVYYIWFSNFQRTAVTRSKNFPGNPPTFVATSDTHKTLVIALWELLTKCRAMTLMSNSNDELQWLTPPTHTAPNNNGCR